MTTREQSPVESHTRAFHAESSYQGAGLEEQSTCKVQPNMSRGNPHLEANSGKQDGRDFNNRGGERGRPISFQSCVEDSEHTDQKAAQVASAPAGPLPDVKTKLMVIRQNVDRNRASWSRLECEWFSRWTTLLQASHLRSNPSCGEGKYRGSELYRRSPRRKRRHAVQPNEQLDRKIREVTRSKITVHSRGGRVIDEVKRTCPKREWKWER